MTLEELREQIQEDLRTYLEIAILYERRDSTGSRRIIDKACQIVVDNFKKLDIGLGYSLPSPRKR